MNLRTRLTVLVAAAVGCAVVLVAAVAVLATRNELRDGVDAVSYTHLDVYKRQAP